MPAEVIYASSEGCAGGTNDDTANFKSLINALPSGSTVVLGPGRWTIRSGFSGGIGKPITIEAGGARSEIYWIPDTAGDTLFPVDSRVASIADKNEEGQLYGPTFRDLKIIAKREKLAHVFNLWRSDNAHFDNVWVEGIKGSSLVMNGTRETRISSLGSRFCGDRETMTPDINIISTTGADTSNYQMWVNVFSVFPFWDGIHLDNADKINFANLMVHMLPVYGDASWLSMFHTYSMNRFGVDLYQDWLDHFNDATNGGVNAVPIRAINGSSMNIANIDLVGGSQHKLVLGDASRVNVVGGYVSGASALDGGLFYADNSGHVSAKDIFVDGSHQIYKSANNGACVVHCTRGPSFSATQDLSQLGANEYFYGGNANDYRLLRLLKALEFGDGVNVAFGSGAGTKLGLDAASKWAFNGMTPTGLRANATQAAVGANPTNAELSTLVNEIRLTLIEKGIFKGSA